MATCGGAGSRVRRIIRFGFSGISQCGQRLGAASRVEWGNQWVKSWV